MKSILHLSTLCSVSKEAEHFYVDIYYFVILCVIALSILTFSIIRYRKAAGLARKNDELMQRYGRELLHVREQLDLKEKCLQEYQSAVRWNADLDVESLVKEKERLAKCLLEQLDTFKHLKLLSKSRDILSDADWVNLIEIVNTLYDNFIVRLRITYPDLTEDAIRFCCLIKLRLTSAELMSILHVTKDAIYKRKFRLKKELMPEDDPRSLDDFLSGY